MSFAKRIPAGKAGVAEKREQTELQEKLLKTPTVITFVFDPHEIDVLSPTTLKQTNKSNLKGLVKKQQKRNHRILELISHVSNT